MITKIIFSQVLQPGGLPRVDAGENQVATVLRIVFMIAGAVAVIVIVIAGLSYVISSGDPQKTARAKDAILYAVIGLVIAILATVIVGFVVGEIF